MYCQHLVTIVSRNIPYCRNPASYVEQFLYYYNGSFEFTWLTAWKGYTFSRTLSWSFYFITTLYAFEGLFLCIWNFCLISIALYQMKPWESIVLFDTKALEIIPLALPCSLQSRHWTTSAWNALSVLHSGRSFLWCPFQGCFPSLRCANHSQSDSQATSSVPYFGGKWTLQNPSIRPQEQISQTTNAHPHRQYHCQAFVLIMSSNCIASTRWNWIFIYLFLTKIRDHSADTYRGLEKMIRTLFFCLVILLPTTVFSPPYLFSSSSNVFCNDLVLPLRHLTLFLSSSRNPLFAFTIPFCSGSFRSKFSCSSYSRWSAPQAHLSMLTTPWPYFQCLPHWKKARFSSFRFLASRIAFQDLNYCNCS